jgi:hypothetical protein
MSQDCSQCGMIQTQQTDFVNHWSHLQTSFLIEDDLEISLLLLQLLA